MSTLNLALDFQRAGDALPCPFCGGAEILTYKYQHTAGERYAIMCAGCVATIDPGWVRARQVVIDLWNKRKAGGYADASETDKEERRGG